MKAWPASQCNDFEGVVDKENPKIVCYIISIQSCKKIIPKRHAKLAKLTLTNIPFDLRSLQFFVQGSPYLISVTWNFEQAAAISCSRTTRIIWKPIIGQRNLLFLPPSLLSRTKLLNYRQSV